MASDEDRKIVRDVAEALKVLNAALDRASTAGIKVEFVNSQQIGSRNDEWMVGRSVREEVI